MPSDEPFHSSVSPNTISNAGIHFFIYNGQAANKLCSHWEQPFVCKVFLKFEYIMKILTRIDWCNCFHNQIQSWDFLWKGPEYSPSIHDGSGDNWLQIVSKGTREWRVGNLYNCHDHKLNLNFHARTNNLGARRAVFLCTAFLKCSYVLYRVAQKECNNFVC